jgi:uncharacterized repeat protein (TIGR01451 family)/fimbrial isopeptide formation D2 family protein
MPLDAWRPSQAICIREKGTLPMPHHWSTFSTRTSTCLRRGLSRVTHALIALATLAAALGLPPAEVAQAVPLIGLNLSLPAQQPIGATFSFTVTFDNTAPNGPGNTGYGPFIDLYFPVEGADGDGAASDDGLDFVSATYLGAPVTVVQLTFPGPGPTGCVNHPYAVAPVTGAPLQVCGNSGNRLVVIQLPFGSFTPDQPPATVTVNAQLSSDADLNVPLTVYARGGYRFGATPTNDWCCPPYDATILSSADPNPLNWTPSASVTPTLLTLTKTYTGPEDETATGPNFPREYTLTATWPNGQPVGNLTLTDFLPNNVAFLNMVSTAPGGATVTQTPTVGAAANPPNNDLVVTWPLTLTSGSASVTFRYFIPYTNAVGSNVINPVTGDDVTSPNNGEASGLWDPLDPRDPVTPTSISVGTIDHTLTDKSIAIQKSVSIVGNVGPAGASPGDTLEYTLSFQVSDFFAFNNVVITDTFSDGQRFASGFIPTLQINGNPYTLAVAPMNAANFTVDVSAIGNDPNPATDGSTTVSFRVSDEIITRGQNGRLVGGCINAATGSPTPNCATYNDGPTTGVLVFRTVIQDAFSDTYPSGDASVDHGDVLSNAVTVEGAVLNTGTFVPTGQREADGSGAGVTIAFGVLQKTVYALNGNTSFTTPLRVRPGDTVTYRLTYSLPTSDFETLVLTDYLPLPVFSVTDPDDNGVPNAWAFDDTISAAAPPAGTYKFGPTETFRPLAGNGVGCPIAPGATGDGTPCVTVNADNNALIFSYGNFDDPANTDTQIDLLFSVTVSDDPFADGLYLTNQARASEGTTNAGDQQLDSIVQIILTQPVLVSTKAAIATSNPAAAVFTPTPPGPVTFNAPGTPGARWAGVINSTNLGASPINSNVSGLDAGDLVSFAIVIQNTGTSTRGAFDITITDTLPAGFVIPTGGLNLRISHGDPTSVLGFTGLGGGPDGLPNTADDLFGAGLQINDPGPNQGACQAHDATNGLNIVVITYDLQLAPSVTPGQVIPNTSALTRYAGSEGGPNHLERPQTDTATTTIAPAGLGKAFVGTNQAFTTGFNVAIGEIITYSVTITVPEGTMQNVVLTDTLDAGLAFVDVLAATASPGLTTSLAGGFAALLNDGTAGGSNPLISGAGGVAAFNLGTLTNSDTNNAVAETVTLTYTVVVLNSPGNDRGGLRNNAVTLTHSTGSANASAPNAVIVEPTLTLTKQATPTTNLDAGDTVTFTLRITNTAPSNAEAFNIVLTDAVPSGLTYVPASFVHTGGAAPASLVEAGGVLTATWNSLALNANSVLQFRATLNANVAPGQSITNIARVQWTSLPGNVTTPQSPYSPVSTERTGDTSDPGGNENDYRANNSVAISVRLVGGVKVIAGTNQAFTAGNNVAIGELITYTVTFTIPEGVAPNVLVTDTLGTGLAFVSLDGLSASPALSTSVAGGFPNVLANAVITNVGAGAVNQGRRAIFNFGTLTNSDNNNAVAETITLTYTVAVLNSSGNNRGTALTNSAQLTWTSGSVTRSAPNVTVVEPTLTPTKTVTPALADAGDVVTFTLRITNTNAANPTNAFNVVLTDVIPGGLTYQAASLAHTGGVVPTTLAESGGVITATWDTLALNASSTLQFRATLNANVAPGQLITNTTNVQWTSLPGDVTTPQTGNNPLSVERTGDVTNPGGADNDHRASASATVTVNTGVFLKALESTSAAHTAGNNVTIGETVTYVLTATLPEGVIPSVVITDNLPLGLAYVPGSAVVDSSSFGGTLPAPTITAPGGNGDDVILDFGAVTVPDDNDPNNNSFAVRLTARVLDVPGNVGFTPPGPTSLPNSATLRTGAALTPSNVVTATVVEPRPAIAKSFAPNPASPNDVVTVTLVVSNTGLSTMFDVVVEDVLVNAQFSNFTEGSTPAGFTFSTTTTGLTTTIRYTGGDIPAGASRTFTFTATLAGSLTHGTVVPNVATVTQATTLPGSDPNERDEPDVSGSANLNIITPDLRLTKTDGLTTVVPGQTVTYTLTITNTNARAADNVVVTETVPANTTFNAAASLPTVWSCADGAAAGTTCTTSLGTLAGAASTSVRFAVNVVNPAPAGVTAITNTASVGDDGTHGADPTPANNTASDTNTLNAAPDLQISKTDGSISTTPGSVIAYTLTYTNAGNQDATGVSLTETVPANTTFTGTGWSCTPNNNAGSICTFTVGALGAGASGTATFTVTVNATVPAGVTQIANTAVIGDDGTNGPDPTPGDNTSSDTTPLDAAPNLQITKTDGGISTTPGGVIAYTLTYTNAGNQDATGVSLTETVPANTTFTGTGWSCTPNNNAGSICTFTVGALGAGASGTATFTVTVNATVPAGVTQIANTAVIGDDGTNGPDPTPGDNTSSDTTPLDAAPNLQITKTDGGISTTPGGVIAYTLTYTNAGNQDATGVSLTETVPANTTFTGTGWSCTPNNNAGSICTFTVGTLNAGASGTASFAVTVNNPLPLGVTQIANTAVIGDDGTNGPEPTPGDNTSSDTTPLNSAGIVLTKEVTPGTAAFGQPITYTLRFTNTGALTLNPVTLTDTLPAGFNFIAGSATPVAPDVNAAPLLVWNNLGPLTSGQSLVVTFAVTASPGALGTFVNVADVSGLTPGGQTVTDTASAPIVLADPVVEVDKRLVAADLDLHAPNLVTFTIQITNTGPSVIDVLPLLDVYDPANLSFVSASPMPDDSVDDGNLTWSDLTRPAPNGFGGNLAPGQSVLITTVFRVVQDITSTTNIAEVAGAQDVFGNDANDVSDAVLIVNVPTAVELVDFRVASVNGTEIELVWETASEVNNAGFRLYRALANDFALASYVTFLPAAGNGVGGATYRYVDNAPASGVWWYWLADVDMQGRETRHGPTSAGVGVENLLNRVYLPLIRR